MGGEVVAGNVEDAGDVEDQRPVEVDGFEVGEAQVAVGSSVTSWPSASSASMASSR